MEKLSEVLNAWEKSRIKYQQRYATYISRYVNSGEKDMDAHGHAMECSYILINLFGLTDSEMRQLESDNYAGLLNRDIY